MQVWCLIGTGEARQTAQGEAVEASPEGVHRCTSWDAWDTGRSLGLHDGVVAKALASAAYSKMRCCCWNFIPRMRLRKDVTFLTCLGWPLPPLSMYFLSRMPAWASQVLEQR